VGGVLLSTARVSRRKIERELRERERTERELAGHVRSLINSFNELSQLARRGLWILKGELLRRAREVGRSVLLVRETLEKLGMEQYDYEAKTAIHYLDRIVSRVKELINMVDQLEHSGDYVRVSPDVASLIDRIGVNINAVLDSLERAPFHYITSRDLYPH
jgi:hypothetical protein